MLPSIYPTKQKLIFGEDELVNPFSMNHASPTGLDEPTFQSYASLDSQSYVSPTNFSSIPFSSFLKLALICLSMINVHITAQKPQLTRSDSTVLTSIR